MQHKNICFMILPAPQMSRSSLPGKPTNTVQHHGENQGRVPANLSSNNPLCQVLHKAVSWGIEEVYWVIVMGLRQSLKRQKLSLNEA